MLFPSKIAQRGRMRDYPSAHFRRRVSVYQEVLRVRQDEEEPGLGHEPDRRFHEEEENDPAQPQVITDAAARGCLQTLADC